MPDINGVRVYTSASVLQFCFSDDVNGQVNAASLQRAWEDYGFEVRTVSEKDWDLPAYKYEKSRGRATSEFIDWLVEQGEDAEKGQERLLLVYFVGHGGVEKETGDHGHLIGCSNTLGIELDITELQHHARDSTPHDVIFMVEACEAMWPGMIDPAEVEDYWNADGQKRMEILAAGFWEVGVDRTHSDFAQRLFRNLRSDTGPRTVEERYWAMRAQEEAEGYIQVYHARDVGTEAITLMPILSVLQETQALLDGYEG